VGKIALAANEVADLTELVKRKKKVNGNVVESSGQETLSNDRKRKSPGETDEQGPDKRPKFTEDIVSES